MLWGAVLVGYVALVGFPLDRLGQTVWILALLFAANVGRPWRTQLRILLDWVPFVGFLLVYDYTRGFADTLGSPVHVTDVVAAERAIAGGTVPTVTLQESLLDPGRVHWYDVAVSLVYFSHFVVPWAVAAVLYVRSRDRWAAWARRILVLSYAGLLTYVIAPAAPPWYAAREGVIPSVDRVAARGWDALGLRTARTLVERGQAGSNEVAAVPSLHAAFAAMLLVFVWSRVGRIWRVVLVLYTLAMAFSLVYAGEHYVVDALLGYAYVAVVAVAVTAWERRRAPELAVDHDARPHLGQVEEPLGAGAVAQVDAPVRRPRVADRREVRGVVDRLAAGEEQ